jgi:cytochrome c oxidase subunit 2
MKKRTGNPNFVYEISCDQICGKGHFSMRGVIVVESEEDYKKWLATQKPEYLTLFPEKDPSKQVKAVDTTAATSKPMAQVMPNNP